MTEPGQCHVCGEPLEATGAIDCYLCGRRFHFSRDRACGIVAPQTIGC